MDNEEELDELLAQLHEQLEEYRRLLGHIAGMVQELAPEALTSTR